MRSRGGGTLRRSWRLARSAVVTGAIAERVHTPLGTSHLQDILLPASSKHAARPKLQMNVSTK
jgi:hypothetical protein